MKGLILSGGKGTRLRPLTYTRAKQLVPVANKPVLFYGVEAIVAAGHPGDRRRRRRHAGGDPGGARRRLALRRADHLHRAGRAARAGPRGADLGDASSRGEPFVMYLGDNVIADGITTLVDEYRKLGCNSQILLAKVPNPSQFGVAELEDGRVVRLTEKPKQPEVRPRPRRRLHVRRHRSSRRSRRSGRAPRNELEITDAIQWLVDHGKSVHPHLVSGWWKDTGKIEDMLEANRIILDTFTARGLEAGRRRVPRRGQGRHRAGREARSTRTVRGPADHRRGRRDPRRLRRARTRPIGPDCLIDRCEIENSIVLEGSRLERIPVRIADSLIGKNVRIHPGPRAAARPPVPGRRQLRDRHRMKLLVTGGCGFIGSNFIRHVLAVARRRRLGRQPRQADLRRPTRPTSPTSRDLPNYRFVRGDIVRPGRRRRGDGGLRRGRQLRGRDPRGPLAARRRVVHRDRRAGRLRPARGGAPPRRRDVHPDLDRRGLRLDRRGLLHRGVAAEPPQPLRGLQGRAATGSRTPTGPPTACRSSSRAPPTTTARTSTPRSSIPLFVTNAIDDQPLPLYGDGRNVRDWLFVRDHAAAIDFLLDAGRARRDLQHRRRQRAREHRDHAARPRRSSASPRA